MITAEQEARAIEIKEKAGKVMSALLDETGADVPLAASVITMMFAGLIAVTMSPAGQEKALEAFVNGVRTLNSEAAIEDLDLPEDPETPSNVLN